jgi:hypothetical protein
VSSAEKDTLQKRTLKIRKIAVSNVLQNYGKRIIQRKKRNTKESN